MPWAAGTSAKPSEEERAFLQRRVATFGLVTAGSFLFFLVYRTALLISIGQVGGLLDPAYGYHVLAGGCLLAIWVACRREPRSARFVRWVETLGLLSTVVASMLMARTIPALERPDFTLLLVFTYVLMARAVFVPSSATRSLVLALAVGVELTMGVWRMFGEPQVFALVVSTQQWSDMTSPGQLAARVTLQVGAWWALTTFITVAASKVIYGLRREVRDAMKLGQYQLEAKLGEGGMGIVYRARHALLQRPTAVKLLHPERAGASSLKHFEREVQQTARLSHPNIVTIFDYGHTPEGTFYYAMEYLDGVTLEAAVARLGPMPSGRVLPILRQMAAALVEAHGLGLIHRDIKPANVILLSPRAHAGAKDTVKLLDFGLVKQLGPAAKTEQSQEGVIVGTPQYLAPEAIRDPSQVDGRTDLYGLGAVGYYLLTGTPVFLASSLVEVASHHLHTPPEPPSARVGRPVVVELERLVLRCLAKSPAERPASAAELEALLAACPDPEPWTPEQSRTWWLELEGLGGRSESAERVEGSALTVDLRRHFAAER